MLAPVSLLPLTWPWLECPSPLSRLAVWQSHAHPSKPTTCSPSSGRWLQAGGLLYKPHALKGVFCHVSWASSLPWMKGQRAPVKLAKVSVSPQTERLTAEQIKEYKGIFEMFDEEGNGEVKTGELERLMSLLGINPTKSELASMAKDVDRDSEAVWGSWGLTV